MQVLSFGYQLPEDGDFGSVWFDALESNIQRLNGHSHDGLDSPLLSSQNIAAFSQTVLEASFLASGDKYRVQLSTPSSRDFDSFAIVCKDPTSKDQMYLEIEKIDATNFYVYINIPQDVEVYFLS